jgi:molybdate transport system ATP-binding protein
VVMAQLSASIQAHMGTFSLNVAFEMQGSTTAILGASGGGKTLTLRAIAGLLHPTSGRIVLGDRVVYDSTFRLSMPTRQRKVGYVFQDYALFPHLTVAKNLAYALHGWDKARRATRARELVDLLDLNGLESRLPGEISGGQQQRVALGRALAPEPDIMLLDEPFSAVDAPARTLLAERLQVLQERLGFGMLLVTHDVSEAYALASELVLVSEGRVIQQGTREDVFHAPTSVKAARLLGFRNLLSGQIVGEDGGHTVVGVQGVRVYCEGGGWPKGTLVLCGIRSQSISLVPHAVGVPKKGSNALPVTVVLRTDRGVRSEVTLAMDGHGGSLLHAEIAMSDLSMELLPGTHWQAIIPGSAVHLWSAHQDEIDRENANSHISI